jgi:hypothetical protein
MADVLEEMTGASLSPGHIEARLRDWEHRIADLYALVGAWLPAGWTAVSNRTTRMLEQPMREVGAPPRYLPVLDLLENGKVVTTIEPRGLWIVGMNGRLDLRRGVSRFLIADMADNFEAPRWKLSSMTDRLRQRPLDRAALLAVLAPD